jgi:hypothetical protein
MTAKRVLISINERLLARIDENCARIGMTRSAYLAQLADRDLEAGSGPGSAPSARAALDAPDALIGDDRP